MEKFNLGGKWRITGGSYDLFGEVPGSVYSALLANGLMQDPFYRDNEIQAIEIMDNEFVFTKQFDYVKKSNSILLVCEGIDTLCDLYINGNLITSVNLIAEKDIAKKNFLNTFSYISEIWFNLLK